MFNPLAARRKSMEKANTTRIAENENREREK